MSNRSPNRPPDPDKPSRAPRVAKAIAALLSSETVEEAARKVGVHERTLFRWLAHPKFKAKLRKAVGDALGHASRRLAYLTCAAVHRLVQEVKAKNPNPAAVRAASVILSEARELAAFRLIQADLARAGAEAADPDDAAVGDGVDPAE